MTCLSFLPEVGGRGGNPQIANADGEAPVQECITMMPG